MLYYSINSREKVFHREGCRHLCRIADDRKGSFDGITTARQYGYRSCSCCTPIAEQLKTENQRLESFCLSNGVSLSLHKGALHIETPYSKWLVLDSFKEGILDLHHENTYGGEHDDSVLGYHKQNCFSKDILGYLKYICNHDNYRKQNPLQIAKKPPKKGTRRYKAEQIKIAKRERRRQICNVLSLIDSLSTVRA